MTNRNKDNLHSIHFTIVACAHNIAQNKGYVAPNNNKHV
jgi:hypothetical protein